MIRCVRVRAVLRALAARARLDTCAHVVHRASEELQQLARLSNFTFSTARSSRTTRLQHCDYLSDCCRGATAARLPQRVLRALTVPRLLRAGFDRPHNAQT